MSRDVFRLAILGSRGGYGRPVGIIIGIAVGVSLLLTLLGAANGMQARDQRTAWLNTFFDVPEDTPALTASEALVRPEIDYFAENAIVRRDIAITKDSMVAFPWGPVPAAGTYLASPALRNLIESNAPEMLEDRYGEFAGLIPNSALASPDSLVVVVGRTEANMRASGWGAVISDLNGVPESNSEVYRTIIIIGGIATFIPILLFVAIVTHLGAAQRAERFSTIRMIGAGAGIISRLAALEMAVLSSIGAVIGIVLWFAARPIASRFSIDDGAFFDSDLGLSWTVVAIICLGAVLGTTIVSVWQTKRAGIGPLGVTRQQMERTPSAIRILPLAAGLALMAVASRTFLGSANQELAGLAVITGFGLTALGIIAVGPWITSIVSRLASRRASSAAGTIAASTIKHHPARTFRSVSGLVVAVFVASVFAGAASSVLDERDTPDLEGALPLTTLVAYLPDPGTIPVNPESVAVTMADLEAMPGVTGVVLAHVDIENWDYPVVTAEDAASLGMTVPTGADYVQFDLNNALLVWSEETLGEVTSVASITNHKPFALLIQTDESLASLETARTELVTSGIVSAANTRSDLADRNTRKFVNSMSNLAYIGIALTVLVAGISLSVSTASSIIERKRIFGLLRLTGMPQSTLRNVVIIEALLPLLAVVGLSIGFGFFVAWLIVDGLSVERSMTWPDSRYVLTIVSSTILAALSVLATVRIANSTTGVTSTRFE